jgi:hypothetical protein
MEERARQLRALAAMCCGSEHAGGEHRPAI